MRQQIIKHTKLLAYELYNRDIEVEFHKLTDCGVCLDNLIWFNERLLSGKVTEDEAGYWWKLMVHEVTHIEVRNEQGKTHIPKFYTAQTRNRKRVLQLKEDFIKEVTA